MSKPQYRTLVKALDELRQAVDYALEISDPKLLRAAKHAAQLVAAANAALEAKRAKKEADHGPTNS